MASKYSVEIVEYPSEVKSGDTIRVKIDWEAGYGEWLLPNIEAYFKFYINGAEKLVTDVYNSDGPGTFEVPLGSLTEGSTPELKVEMWDKDVISDDRIAFNSVELTVPEGSSTAVAGEPGYVPDGGTGFVDLSEENDVKNLLAKYFTYLIVGSIVIAIILMVIMKVELTVGALLVAVMMPIIGWAIYKYWNNENAIYVGATLCIVNAALPLVYPEAYSLIDGAMGTTGSMSLPF